MQLLNRFKIDLRNLQFTLFEHLEIQKLFQSEKFSNWDQETIESVLKEAEKVSVQKFAPANIAGDQTKAQFQEGKVTLPQEYHEAYRIFCENGFTGASAAPEWEGMGLPKVIATAMDEMFISANASLHTCPSLSRAAADVILQWGTPEQKERYVRKLYTGEWQGTMCLTEAEAGSDVGNSRTVAFKRGEKYFLKGTKVFITSGDHDLTPNHVHLVLARLEGAPEGTKGLSLFIVSKYHLGSQGELQEAPNDLRCGGIEHKMGIHGSPTTTMLFGENDQCLAELLGAEGQGMRVMFQMMNEERIMVGCQGVGLAAASYFMAEQYAQERIQGSDIQAGKKATLEKVPIIKHPDIRRLLMHIKAYVDAGRALLLYTAYAIDLASLEKDPQRQAKLHNRVELFTPICKAWCTDVGFLGCTMAMQVFGGYGYISEYHIEQYVRDSRIASVYEGTNGIQALDLLFRKVPQKNGQLLKEYLEELQNFVQNHQSHPALGKEVQILGKSSQKIQEVTFHLLELLQKEELKKAALSASTYLNLLGNLIGGHFILEQALLAHKHLNDLPSNENQRHATLEENTDLRFYYNKVAIARFYIHQILSENLWRCSQITSQDYSALDVQF